MIVKEVLYETKFELSPEEISPAYEGPKDDRTMVIRVVRLANNSLSIQIPRFDKENNRMDWSSFDMLWLRTACKVGTFPSEYIKSKFIEALDYLREIGEIKDE